MGAAYPPGTRRETGSRAPPAGGRNLPAGDPGGRRCRILSCTHFGGPPKEEESVYPPRFDYLAPTSVEEVVEALGERAGDAKVMAGGQSLIPVLKLRIASVKR